MGVLSGLGLKQEEIALLVINPRTSKPIDGKTLRLHFARELEVGMAQAKAKVAQSLFNKAIGTGPQSVTAAIWFSKCRMGWREQTHDGPEDKSGVLVSPPATSPDSWIAAQGDRDSGSSKDGG